MLGGDDGATFRQMFPALDADIDAAEQAQSRDGNTGPGLGKFNEVPRVGHDRGDEAAKGEDEAGPEQNEVEGEGT